MKNLKLDLFIIAIFILGLVIGIIIGKSASMVTKDQVCAQWGGKSETFEYKGYDIFWCYKEK